jgi:capsular polysaccharide biosynthesis protein
MSMLRSPRTRAMIVDLRERWRHLLPVALLRRLPPDRRHFVGFDQLERSAALTQSAGCRVLYAATVRPLTRRPPLGGYPQRWSAMEAIASRPAHRRFVVSLNGACVSGLLPAIVLRSGDLFADASRVLNLPAQDHPTFSRLRLPARQVLGGRTLLLAAGHSGNFYHWFVDTLPRLRLLQRAGVDLSQFDHVILPGASGRYIADSLDHVPELRAERHVTDDSTHFECDELTCASNLHPAGESSRWALAFLRRTLLGRHPSTAGAAKLFLSRSRAPRRRLVNEEEIWNDFFEPAGFTRVFLDDLPLEQQVAIVADAETIAAPHGAALTHMVFAPPGCSIIELMSESYPTTYFWNLADAMRHRYRYVVCRSVNGALIDNTLDFAANPNDVARCLADAGIAAPRRRVSA